MLLLKFVFRLYKPCKPVPLNVNISMYSLPFHIPNLILPNKLLVYYV